MNIGKTLNLKDYRIIKILLENRIPEECAEEIRLPLLEIKARETKIKKYLGVYLHVICNEM